MAFFTRLIRAVIFYYSRKYLLLGIVVDQIISVIFGVSLFSKSTSYIMNNDLFHNIARIEQPLNVLSKLRSRITNALNNTLFSISTLFTRQSEMQDHQKFYFKNEYSRTKAQKFTYGKKCSQCYLWPLSSKKENLSNYWHVLSLYVSNGGLNTPLY